MSMRDRNCPNQSQAAPNCLISFSSSLPYARERQTGVGLIT